MGAGILSIKGDLAGFELREKPVYWENTLPLDPSKVPARLFNQMIGRDMTNTDPRHERCHLSPKHGMTLGDQWDSLEKDM